MRVQGKQLILRSLAALRVEVPEFLHAIFTHGSLELLIFGKAFVDFSQVLVTDQEKVGAAVASVELLEHSPMRTWHALLIPGLGHLYDLGPLLFFPRAHVEEHR